MLFTKPPSTVIGPGAEIPPHKVTAAIDWEAELAVIIGREGRDIAEGDAMAYVFGYTLRERRHGARPAGPAPAVVQGQGPRWLLPARAVHRDGGRDARPARAGHRCTVNGVEKQHSNTRHLIFKIPRLIAEWSAGMTLYPGDILLTGTPSGVGIGRKPPEFLKPGDVVEVRIEGIGVLRNRRRKALDSA